MRGSLDFEKANRIDKTRGDGANRNVNKITIKSPPTEAQLELIQVLKTKLENYGKDISYIVEPDSRFIARHVIDSLLRLCRKYNL